MRCWYLSHRRTVNAQTSCVQTYRLTRAPAAGTCLVGSRFVLFDLIIYVPSTIFQLNRDGASWVEPVLSKDKHVCFAQGHNTVTPVRLEPAAPRS